jgi:hypothetical protein
MIRKLFAVATAVIALAVTGLTDAQEKKDEKKDEKKATVDLFASLDDRELQKAAPESGVIASVAAWEKLAKAWGIKEPARVDFDKEFLFVATTVGSRLNVTGGRIDDKGDFKVAAIATRDLRPGFRYSIKSFPREGVKTVNGKELPKE